MKVKKVIGIVLIILQVIATVNAIASGDFAEILNMPLIPMVGVLIGFFLIGVIGIILLITPKKKLSVAPSYTVSCNTLLPIGSVVQLKNGSKKLMIIGVKQTDVSSDKEYDYLSVIYPEGFVNDNTLFFFNHNEIDKVFHSGMHDEEREKFIGKLNDFYKN